MAEPIRADRGYFHGFGGAYIPEILHATFEQLSLAFETADWATFSNAQLDAGRHQPQSGFLAQSLG